MGSERKSPYERGVEANTSNNPEPECPYSDEHQPREYSEWCDGFCHNIHEVVKRLNGSQYGN